MKCKHWFKIEFYDNICPNTIEHRLAIIERQYISFNQADAMAHRYARNYPHCKSWLISRL